MTMVDYLRFLAALIFVLGLIGLLYWLVRRYAAHSLGSFGMSGSGGGRLQVVESRPIDPRHRLVLVRRDSVEHLLLLGTEGDLVVERGIPCSGFQAALDKENIVPATEMEPKR